MNALLLTFVHTCVSGQLNPISDLLSDLGTEPGNKVCNKTIQPFSLSERSVFFFFFFFFCRYDAVPPPSQSFHQPQRQQYHRLSGWGWIICYCQCIALVVVRCVVSALFGGGGGGLLLPAIAFTMFMLRFSSANLTVDCRAGLDAYSTGPCGSVA